MTLSKNTDQTNHFVLAKDYAEDLGESEDIIVLLIQNGGLEGKKKDNAWYVDCSSTINLKELRRAVLRIRIFEAADKLVEQPSIIVHGAAVLNEALGFSWGDQRKPAAEFYKEWCLVRGYRGRIAYCKQTIRNILTAAIVIISLAGIYVGYKEVFGTDVEYAAGIAMLVGGILGTIALLRLLRPIADRFLSEKPRKPASPQKATVEEE